MAKTREEDLRESARAALSVLREIAPHCEVAGLPDDATLAVKAARELARSLDRFLTETQPLD